ncbi:MAG: UbiA family prenyltransferase, partial [Bacteroidota bacterium]
SLKTIQLQPVLDLFLFSQLVLVTIIITANGYIINDLLDQKSDAINKPEGSLVGQIISEKNVNWLYFSLLTFGFLVSVSLALHFEKRNWLFLYPGANLVLFYYSYQFKKQPLLGNIIVALFCSGVAAILFVAESESLKVLQQARPDIYYKFSSILRWYMAFAFLGTLIREIVKDIEDIEGDRADACKTAPIVWGVSAAKRLALALSGLLLILLFYQLKVFSNHFNNSVFYYSICSILLPFLLNSYLLIRAKSTEQFHVVSQVLKFILLAGILLIFFVKI